MRPINKLINSWIN